MENQQYKALDKRLFSATHQGKFDLAVLKHMALHVRGMLARLEQSGTSAQPLLYYAEERRQRIHRIAIYNPQELRLNSSIAFVGFVSGKRQPGSTSIANEILTVDKLLIAELTGIPGILSYSSLERSNGNWYNLVLLSHLDMKRHIKNNETHAYAAHQLAPRYYDWIRLHNGAMPGGLATNEMVLQRTKLYIFHEEPQWPIVSERAPVLVDEVRL